MGIRLGQESGSGKLAMGDISSSARQGGPTELGDKERRKKIPRILVEAGESRTHRTTPTPVIMYRPVRRADSADRRISSAVGWEWLMMSRNPSSRLCFSYQLGRNAMFLIISPLFGTNEQLWAI